MEGGYHYRFIFSFTAAMLLAIYVAATSFASPKFGRHFEDKILPDVELCYLPNLTLNFLPQYCTHLHSRT
jgi:hypothetical protein